MRWVYSFPLEGDVSAMDPALAEMTGRINKAMSSFGFEEKMHIRSVLGYANVSSDRILLAQEVQEIRATLQDSLGRGFPDLKIGVGSPIVTTEGDA